MPPSKREARPEEAPYPYRRHLRLVASMVVTAGVSSFLIGRAFGAGAAFAFLVLGCFAVTFLFRSRTALMPADGIILALFVGIIAGLFLPPLQRLEEVPRLHQTTPVALPDAPEAGVFTFREGTQVPEFTGFQSVTVESKDSKGRRTTSQKLYGAAPLVGPGWTREQPVPAWSVCESHSGSREECEQLFRTPVRAGIAVSPKLDPHFLEAVGRAQGEHGLSSMQGARLVELVPDADQEIRGRWLTLVLVVLGGFGLWAAILSIIWAWQNASRRRLAGRYRHR